MYPRLGEVCLSGDWAQFLEGLGWTHYDGVWRGCGAAFLSSDEMNRPECVSIDLPDSRSLIVHRSDSSFLYSNNEGRPASAFSKLPALIHVAIDVPAKDTAISDIIRQYGTSCIIPRSRRFDAGRDAVVDSEHLYTRGQLYLNVCFEDHLRCSRLAHIGWECQQQDEVDRAVSLLARCGWEVVAGPLVLDCSYLVHFRGPDGRIHDLYHPLPSLFENNVGAAADTLTVATR